MGDEEEEEEEDKRGADGQASKATSQYGNLDDRNVWNESER